MEDANIMVARIIILLLLCESRKVWWTLEQPVNSLLERQPLFQAFLRFPSIHVRRLTTSMGWFGGKTRKPTWVYSSARVAAMSNKGQKALRTPTQTFLTFLGRVLLILIPVQRV